MVDHYTDWYCRNSKDEEWKFNHREWGWNMIDDVPTPSFMEQKHNWPKKYWKKRFGSLDMDFVNQASKD